MFLNIIVRIGCVVSSNFHSCKTNRKHNNILLASFAQSVRQVMDRVFSFLLWPKREARGP